MRPAVTRRARRRGGRRSTRAPAVLGLGVLAVPAGAGLAAAVLYTAGTAIPAARADERAFAAAVPCTRPLSAGDAREECLRDVEFTVRAVSVSPGRQARHSALLARGGRPPRWVGFRGGEPLLERLERGERVTGTVWRGQVVRITGRGTTQLTDAHPAGGSGDMVFLGVSAAAGTAGACGIGWWALTRHRLLAARARVRNLSAEGWAGLGLGGCALASVPLAAGAEWPLWWTAPVWAAASAGIVLLGRRRPGRRPYAAAEADEA